MRIQFIVKFLSVCHRGMKISRVIFPAVQLLFVRTFSRKFICPLDYIIYCKCWVPVIDRQNTLFPFVTEH